MKKLSIAILLTTLACAGCSHHHHEARKIEVSGVAEKETTTDIINVTIELKEYKNGTFKVSIGTLETQLEKAVVDAGIAKSDLTISDLSSFSEDYWQQRKKGHEFLASKTYNIRFHDLTRFDRIIAKVDAKGIQSTDIAGYDYSKLAQEKRDLKIKALKAAKDKAEALVSSIDEKLGRVINISEFNYSDKSQYSKGDSSGYSSEANFVAFDASAQHSDIGTKKMKLQFQVNAVFEIAD